MKRHEAIQLCLEHIGVDSVDEALQMIIVSDECHNVSVCPVCEETWDVEPDAQPFPCHNGCVNPKTGNPAKTYPFTMLAGVDV